MGEDQDNSYANRLLDQLYGWVPLSVSFRLALRELIKLQREFPKSIIIDSSQHAKRMWYSLDSFVVGYDYTRGNGQKVTRIYLPGDVFTDLSSFFQNKPAKLKLVILQGGDLLYVTRADFNGLRQYAEGFDLIQHLMLLEQELESWRGWIMTLRDEQKVAEFNQRYPMYLLPNHICASFLQMTPSRYSAVKANFIPSN